MGRERTNPAFYAALEEAAPSSSGGPVNSAAIVREKNVALEKASSLLGYQNYLTQARSWKAAHEGVTLGFEREVQAQASQALSDARDLAAATLRTTKHLKQAGELDRMLDTWTAGVRASGPVEVQDLWSDLENDLENDPQARQVLRDEGVTDELWSAISENMKKVEGRLFLQGGKLAAEFKTAGQDRARSVVFAHSATGMPRSVTELLRRGQFERMVEQFGRDGALPLSLDVVAGEPREVEIADVVLGGSILSVQMLAQHKRKLQDTGLSTYAGGEVIIAIILVGLVIGAIGVALWNEFDCEDEESREKNRFWCGVGSVLLVLAWFVFCIAVFGILGLILGPGESVSMYTIASGYLYLVD